MNGLLKGITGTVLLLGFVSFLLDISSEMVLPLLPVFLVSIGGTGLAIGLVSGISDSIAAFLKVFSGYFSDRLGKRKPIVIAGYGASFVAKGILFFSVSWLQVLVYRALDRLGKGVREAPRDAIIADETKQEFRGKAFGLHRLFDSGGAIIGSMLSFVFFLVLGFSFKKIFFVSAAIAFFAVLPLFLLREKKAQKKAVSLAMNIKALPPKLKRFFVVAGLFSIANFSYMFFVLRAQQQLGIAQEHAIASVLLLYVLFNVFYALLAVPAGMLSDKIGRRKTIVSGYVLFGLVCLGFSVANSFWFFLLLFPLYGLFFAVVEGNQRAMATDAVPREMRGSAVGAFQTVIGMTTLPAGLIAGYLWDFSPALPFLLSAAIAFASALIFFLQNHSIKSPNKKAFLQKC